VGLPPSVAKAARGPTYFTLELTVAA